MKRDAVLSECARYRYRLLREWADGPTVLWVMLNPSTADASVDDPTIRRCIAFSRALGFGRMWVGNLYALRSTDPAALLCEPEPWGIGNLVHLRAMACESALVMAAWGAHPSALPGYVRQVYYNCLPSDEVPVRCLGVTKSGAPRHPLYVRGDTVPIEYRPPDPTGTPHP